MFAGGATQLFGASVSATVTVKPQLVVLFDASLAVQLTVVVPFGNAVPDAGTQTTVAVEHPSLATAV
jgi:hypothetical protein